MVLLLFLRCVGHERRHQQLRGMPNGRTAATGSRWLPAVTKFSTKFSKFKFSPPGTGLLFVCILQSTIRINVHVFKLSYQMPRGHVRVLVYVILFEYQYYPIFKIFKLFIATIYDL
jgi:hypothetical protein